MKAPLRPRNDHDRELRREEPPSYCWRDECTVAPCSLYLVLLSNFVDYLGSCINVIILPFLVTERFGGSPVWIGGILAAKSLSSAIFPPVITGLADRYGRATVLRAANFGCGVAVLLQAFAQSLVQLMAASFVVGSFVVVLEVCQVYITDVCAGGVEANPESIGDSAGDEGTGHLADTVDTEDGRGEARQPLLRTRMLNYLQATAPLAAVFGPVLGGFLSQISWAFPYYFAAGLSLGMGVLNCLFLAESPAWLATRVRDADAAEVEEVDGAGRHVSISSELFSTALASNNKKGESSDDTKQREVLVSLRAQVLTAIYTDNALRNFTSGGCTAVFAFFCAQRLFFSVIETSYVLALASLAIVLATTTVIGRLQTCFGHRDLIAYAAVATGAFMACIDLVALGFLHQDAPQQESVPQMNKQVTEGTPLLFACLTVTVILLNIAHTARTCSQPCLLALAAPDVATRGQVFGLLCMYGNVGRVAGSVLASLSASAVSLDAPWWFLGAVGVGAGSLFAAQMPPDVEERLLQGETVEQRLQNKMRDGGGGGRGRARQPQVGEDEGLGDGEVEVEEGIDEAGEQRTDGSFVLPMAGGTEDIFLQALGGRRSRFSLGGGMIPFASPSVRRKMSLGQSQSATSRPHASTSTGGLPVQSTQTPFLFRFLLPDTPLVPQIFETHAGGGPDARLMAFGDAAVGLRSGAVSGAQTLRHTRTRRSRSQAESQKEHVSSTPDEKRRTVKMLEEPLLGATSKSGTP